MSKFKERLYNPTVVVTLSVTISVIAYLLIALIINMPSFTIGLILSIIIPIAVSLPISVVMIDYFKKIRKQKVELARLDSINKKLFSLISHDIKSPIATLKGIVDILAEGGFSMEEGKAHLAELSKNIDNVLDFLNDLMQWSKKQTENRPLEFSSFKSNDVIKTVCDLLDSTSKAKHIKLTFGNLTNTIYADKDIYAFVFRNILHNAIKFTPERGSIKIRTEVKNNKVYTIITDSGIGISQEDIEKILDNEKWFTRKGTCNETGTGFGINACINYLKENMGEILIESKPGQGTTVSIILPAKAPAL